MPQCPKCNNYLNDHAKFCAKCGASIITTAKPAPNYAPSAESHSLANICTKCGAKVKIGAKFCPKCGGEVKQIQVDPPQQQGAKICTNPRCPNYNKPGRPGAKRCTNCGGLLTDANVSSTNAVKLEPKPQETSQTRPLPIAIQQETQPAKPLELPKPNPEEKEAIALASEAANLCSEARKAAVSAEEQAQNTETYKKLAEENAQRANDFAINNQTEDANVALSKAKIAYNKADEAAKKANEYYNEAYKQLLEATAKAKLASDKASASNTSAAKEAAEKAKEDCVITQSACSGSYDSASFAQKSLEEIKKHIEDIVKAITAPKNNPGLLGSVKCGRCGKMVPAAANFCIGCGNDLEKQELDNAPSMPNVFEKQLVMENFIPKNGTGYFMRWRHAVIAISNQGSIKVFDSRKSGNSLICEGNANISIAPGSYPIMTEGLVLIPGERDIYIWDAAARIMRRRIDNKKANRDSRISLSGELCGNISANGKTRFCAPVKLDTGYYTIDVFEFANKDGSIREYREFTGKLPQAPVAVCALQGVLFNPKQTNDIRTTLKNFRTGEETFLSIALSINQLEPYAVPSGYCLPAAKNFTGETELYSLNESGHLMKLPIPSVKYLHSASLSGSVLYCAVTDARGNYSVIQYSIGSRSYREMTLSAECNKIIAFPHGALAITRNGHFASFDSDFNNISVTADPNEPEKLRRLDRELTLSELICPTASDNTIFTIEGNSIYRRKGANSK